MLFDNTVDLKEEVAAGVDFQVSKRGQLVLSVLRTQAAAMGRD